MDSSSFPSSITITREQLNAFHRFDRAAFSRIVISMSGAVNESLHVMSFLIFLERRKIGSKLIFNLIPLPEVSINAIVDEVNVCLRCLTYDFFPTFVNTLTKTNGSIPWINRMTGENLTLGIIHQNREGIRLELANHLTSVCFPAFVDLCERFETLSREEMYSFSQFLCGPQEPSNHVAAGRNVAGDQHVTADDRTVFLKFSKGYLISKAEVHDYFTRRFGDIVEAIHMDGVGWKDQGLYAIMVLRSAAKILEVVNNGVDSTKFTINGKHFWGRKFIPSHKSFNYN